MAGSNDHGSDKVTPEVCKKACKYAARVLDGLNSYSKLEDCTHSLPLLERDEVVVGELLGQGGFNKVFEVKAIDLHETADSSKPEQIQARKKLIKRARFHSLAIKFLNDLSSEDYCNGAADLLLETKYLSSISAFYPHPNILRLHAIAAAGCKGFETIGGYFLVFDKLVDTLDRRLEVWKELDKRKRMNMSREHEYHLKALFVKRLIVGRDLIAALQHLHKLRVIFRDLKPDNVGFDSSGILKLFDFGLAKELDPRQKNASGKYDMSGATGSRRYMAPEVAREESYTLSADVFSFGIVLWEVMSMEKAFWEMSTEKHRELVIHGDVRPKIPTQWSSQLQRLIAKCWNGDAAQRPPTKQVQKMMEEELDGFARESQIYVPRPPSVSPPPQRRQSAPVRRRPSSDR